MSFTLKSKSRAPYDGAGTVFKHVQIMFNYVPVVLVPLPLLNGCHWMTGDRSKLAWS